MSVEKTMHPVDIYTGRKLRIRRTMLGMSQDTLGRAVGVTFQQIQKYERGVNRMGSSRLYAFSQVLKVPVSYFFEGYEASQAEAGSQPQGMSDSGQNTFEHERLTSRETLELMRAYNSITDSRTRKRIANLIKTVSSAA